MKFFPPTLSSSSSSRLKMESNLTPCWMREVIVVSTVVEATVTVAESVNLY